MELIARDLYLVFIRTMEYRYLILLVLKEAQSISAEQLAIFQRLYTPNARPVQPVGERIVKESR